MKSAGVLAMRNSSVAALALTLLLAACSGGGGGGGSTPTPPLPGGGGGGGGGGAGGSTPPTWTRQALGSDAIVTSVARSSTGSTFVALVDASIPGDHVLTSTDGRTWIHPAFTGLPPSNDVTFGNGLFVAVGSLNEIATSPDGTAWTTRLNCSCLGAEMLSVAWSGSAFVAVGEAGLVYSSPDGISWTSRATPLGTSSNVKLRRVAGSGSTFVAVGRNAAVQGAVIYSTDSGVTWNTATLVPSAGSEIDNVTWDGSRFIVGLANTNTWASSDGANWSHISTAAVSDITSAGSGYIGTNGVGAMKTSTDAINWANTYDFVHHGIERILWMADRNEYLAVGGTPGTSGFIASSTDAVTWHARYTSERRTSVLWDGSRFVSIDSNGRVFTSSDGLSWDSTQIVPSGGISRIYHDIAWSGTRYVVVGLDQILSSTDGSAWTAAALSGLGEFVTVTWNGAEFAALTRGGRIFRSASGTTWPASGTAITSTVLLNDLAWSSTLNRYVAVGANGNVFFSDDGTAWTARSAATSSLRNVVWAGTQFVAVGDNGTVVTSPNGDTWTNRSIAGGPTFNAVGFIDNQLVAAGSGGRVFVSSNGIGWTEETTGTTLALFAVAGSPTRKVAMGDRGVIVSRP